MEKNFKRTTVTSALPYANGPVHIGCRILFPENQEGRKILFPF